jgi:ankyrin repeat protein
MSYCADEISLRIASLIAAARFGCMRILETLHENRAVNGFHPEALENSALRFACEHGHVQAARFLLDECGDLVDPTAKENYAVGMACCNGHVEIVKLLMMDKRVDPSSGKTIS